MTLYTARNYRNYYKTKTATGRELIPCQTNKLGFYKIKISEGGIIYLKMSGIAGF
jgi:hypothetical protein